MIGTEIRKGTIFNMNTRMNEEIAIATESVMNQIFTIRGQRVMLDVHLAQLYEVENRVLKQAVKRKQQRFPEDFMFQLSKDEWRELITICDNLPDGAKYSPATPFVFTEQGVAMLSSVLNSERAVAVNIQIMRIFTRIRQMLTDNAEIWREIAGIKIELTKQARSQDSQHKNIDLIFEYIDRLQEKVEPSTRPERNRIGFEVGGRSKH